MYLLFIFLLMYTRESSLFPYTTLFRSGWLLGLGLFGSGASWIYVSIHVHGYAPVPLAVFLTLLFVDRKSTRLNSSHVRISYAVFCLKKKTGTHSISRIDLHSNVKLVDM